MRSEGLPFISGGVGVEVVFATSPCCGNFDYSALVHRSLCVVAFVTLRVVLLRGKRVKVGFSGRRSTLCLHSLFWRVTCRLGAELWCNML